MSPARKPKKNAPASPGTFGPWDSVESGFPWAFFQVDVLSLLTHLKIPGSFYFRAIQLLAPSPPTKPIDKHDRAFRKKVAQLTDAKRRSFCWINSAGVYIRDGHALRTNPWMPGQTLFESNPIGVLRNSLFCIEDEWLRKTSDNLGSYFRCDALTFLPTNARDDFSGEPIRPWLYMGGGDYRPCLGALRNDRWRHDMEEAYGAARESITRAWLREVPSAAKPNPVYRFIANPSVRLRREADTFMRLALGDGEPRIVDTGDRPARCSHGPVFCSKPDLNRALGNMPRSKFVDRYLLTPQNLSGTIWRNPKRSTREHNQEYWFALESDFQSAEKQQKTLERDSLT